MRRVEDEAPKHPRDDFERTVRQKLDQAEQDPDAFWDELKATGRNVGAAAEHVYREVQRDPQGVRKTVLNKVTSRVAQKLKQIVGD